VCGLACGPQAKLPFKSKPKDERKHKRKLLEARRAVVLEPQEKKSVALYQQLNAIRNQKAEKRREAKDRRKKARARSRFAVALLLVSSWGHAGAPSVGLTAGRGSGAPLCALASAASRWPVAETVKLDSGQ
jgi:hypothetical protein